MRPTGLLMPDFDHVGDENDWGRSIPRYGTYGERFAQEQKLKNEKNRQGEEANSFALREYI